MARFFIDRPIVAIVIAIVTVIGGIVMIGRLPIAQYPDIVPPIIQIKTTYTGADALAVEASVATPIEQQVNGVQKMIYMKSINGSDGTLTLQVSFEVGTNVDLDQVFTQNRLSQASSQLPSSVVEYGTTVQQTVGLPLLVVPIYSPDGSYDAEFLGNYATINVSPQLARVRGVGQVTLFGAADYAMRVWVRPDTLSKLQITVTDVINAVKAQNVVNPAGQIGAEPAPAGQEFTYTVTAKGRLVQAEQFGEIIVRANPDGSFVRLRDVARIELGAQNYMQIGRYQGKPAAILAIYQSPGSNALETGGVVKAQMEEMAARFPADMAYAIALDTTLPVSEGITEIMHTLVEAMVLVILVVFLFLQGWRATLIPLIAVPVSLIGAFIFFPMLGFSINTLSLLGLVLAIGLVVDDAIVVVEAVEVGIHNGLSPRDATIKAMDEVTAPVIGIALILAAVFIPAGFMTGITGSLYQQFAITIAISVLISAFNALSLSPALCAMLLRPKAHGGGGGLLDRFFAAFNRGFDRVTAGYIRVSDAAIKRTFRSMILLAGMTVIAVGVGRILPTSFVPSEDQGYFFMQLQLPDAASLQRTDVVAREVERILAETEGVQSYTSIVGFSLLSNISQSYAGFYFVQLDPWGDRGERTASVILGELNAKLRELPGALAFGFPPPSIPGVGNSGGFDVMLQDRGGHDVEWLAAERAPLHRGREQATRARRRRHRVPARRAAAVRERGRGQGLQARRLRTRRVRHAAGAARLDLREPVQPLRTRLEGVLAGRARVPREGRGHRRLLRAQPRAADGAALDAGQRAVVRRPRVHQPLQPVPRHRGARQSRAGLQLRSGDGRGRGRGGGGAAVRHELRVDEHVVPGGDRGRRGRHVHPLDGVRVPDPRGAVRELVAAVERSAHHAGRGVRRVPRASACAGSRTTCSRRSV